MCLSLVWLSFEIYLISLIKQPSDLKYDFVFKKKAEFVLYAVLMPSDGHNELFLYLNESFWNAQKHSCQSSYYFWSNATRNFLKKKRNKLKNVTLKYKFLYKVSGFNWLKEYEEFEICFCADRNDFFEYQNRSLCLLLLKCTFPCAATCTLQAWWPFHILGGSFGSKLWDTHLRDYFKTCCLNLSKIQVFS